ncbi:hypothetical protein [Bacillus pseudomycoides]|uniref:hypothetical protein n=1 Tax=Bacillus pseudomycoides TaxID=64104 RepID=UPI000BEBD56A|nr:hypothetical protein [Bacillus pseudomycoides]PEF72276.1 hypothetical protein CON94_27290 [Bacillus pseudomycoides]PEI39633.1 hypothetical protein CN641_26330 [Bacillus pseudomycoides]PEL80633.1 hypothetical protein CN615_24260 [Bacillus pseudomycoides]PGA65531.1 hypothetical protein COL87_27160 [Bacillus pseudomycoides]PHE13895.1 hypothetical protein COF59_13565 [Bacillus pseudomycoides]
MKRTGEDVIGLIGALLGFLCSLVILLLGRLADEMGRLEGAEKSLTIGCMGTLFSILGFFGFIKAKSSFKEAGFLMIVSAIGLLACVNQITFYLFSGLALLLSGLNNIFGKK